MVKRIVTVFCFLYALLWGVSGLKKAETRLQYDVFNMPVIVEVVGLPICGRSNIIEVKYQKIKYNISINKNDCIQGRYNIGDTLEATYNYKLEELNPGHFVGVYRVYMVSLVLVGIVFILYLIILNEDQKKMRHSRHIQFALEYKSNNRQLSQKQL